VVYLKDDGFSELGEPVNITELKVKLAEALREVFGTDPQESEFGE
jgi:hypothetical protein